MGTPTSAASLPIFTEARVPFVGPFTGAELLRNPFNRYVFNVRASYYDETEAIVQHLTAMSIDRIAVFYQNDAYGQAGLAGVERALKKRNLEIAARGTVERNTVRRRRRRSTRSSKAQPAGGRHDQRLQVVRRVHPRDEERSAPTRRSGTSPSSAARRSHASSGKDGRGVQISQVVPFPWDPTVPVVKEYRKLPRRGQGASPTSGRSRASSPPR